MVSDYIDITLYYHAVHGPFYAPYLYTYGSRLIESEHFKILFYCFEDPVGSL